MEFTISCDCYIRAANLANSLDTDNDTEYMRSIFAEVKSGKLYIFATNRKLATVEYCGETQLPDSYVNISVTDTAFYEQCKKEAKLDGTVTFIYVEMLQHVTAKTMFGYIHPANLFHPVPEINYFNNWRENVLPKDKPKKSHGNITISLERMVQLDNASPSGIVVLPSIVDTRQHIIVRDLYEENWIGVFVSIQENELTFPYSIPEWL